MQALNGDLAKIVSSDASTFDPKTGTRNEFMRALGRKLDLTVTGFNAFRTDPQLRQIRSDLADRAERTTFGDGKNATVSCPDPQLQMALRGVVKAIDQLPELQKPEVAAVEGSEATIEAFRRLTTTFYGLLSFKMPPSADELRELQKKAVQSVENPPDAEVRASRAFDGEAAGLSKRDYVPLAVALFVDLCLFLVSMAQRPAGRLDGLVPKMKAAERGPVIEILSRFNDIHRDQQIRENFELFRHVVFDMNGDYYVAVPLDAPPRMNPAEREELRVEAQLLANLFASFEREKIFKRTLLPTTGSIQKRLGRQGSKFAGSESFRVYKFAQRRLVRHHPRRRHGRRPPRRSGRRRRSEQPPTRLAETGRARAAGCAGTQTGRPQRRASNATPHRPAPTLSIDPQHAMRFGPYAETYRPDPASPPYYAPPRTRRTPAAQPEADATVKAANSNTARTAPIVPPPSRNTTATVVPMPRAQHSAQANDDTNSQSVRDPAMARVTLQRETATFTVPVSEAAIPDSLKVALAGADQNWANVVRRRHRRHRLLPVREPASASHEPPPRLPEDQLSAEDRAFIRRIAPPAAE